MYQMACDVARKVLVFRVLYTYVLSEHLLCGRSRHSQEHHIDNGNEECYCAALCAEQTVQQSLTYAHTY